MEIVLVMGPPAAGKSTSVASFTAAGYRRINRDERGGSLDDLVPLVEAAVREGGVPGVVLDNTYPTARSRRPLIELGRRHGVPVRAVWLATSYEDASVNAVLRMIARHGRLLEPAEIVAASRKDPNTFGPVVLDVHRKNFQPPTVAEGFARVDRVEFVRREDPAYTGRALLLDYDGTIRRTASGAVYPSRPDDVEILPGRREVLERWRREGYRLLGLSNQGDVGNGKLSIEAARACFERTHELLGLEIELAFCPHKPRPPSCWCRKPLPGMAVAWIEKYRLAREGTILVGDMDSDRELARRVGVRYVNAEEFFAGRVEPPSRIGEALETARFAARVVEVQAAGLRAFVEGLESLEAGDAATAATRFGEVKRTFAEVAVAYGQHGPKLLGVPALVAEFEGRIARAAGAVEGLPDLGRLGLGAMRLSTTGRPDEATAIRVLLAAFEAGIVLVDTADVYAVDHTDRGHNERLVARALREWKGDASRIVVATKGGLVRRGARMFPDGRPEHLRAACEASLRSLGREAIDLYQLHAPDSKVPFADSVGALADLRRQGKIRHVGLSNVKPARIAEALAIVPIAAVQNKLNPFDAGSFKDGTLEFCRKRGIPLLAHSPVGGHAGRDRPARDATLGAIGARRGATPHEVCLAWLLSAGPGIVPLPGATREETVRSCLRGAALRLEKDDLDALRRRFPFARLREPDPR